MTREILERELAVIRAEYRIPTVAVSVIAAGQPVYAGGSGYIDTARQTPVTGDTRFRVASISKLFTAQAIMQLAEAQKLRLSDPVAQYLPAFEGSHITILQLLTHSSGLRDEVRPAPSGKPRSEKKYLQLVSAATDSGQAGRDFAYSDSGFNLLGAVVSNVAEVPFADYIRDHLLRPANMHHSGYFDGLQGVAPQALPTYRGEVLTAAQRRPFDTSFYPSEGLVTSAADLARWLAATLNQDSTLLSAAGYRQMLEPRVQTSWGDIHMGLGWQVYEKGGRFIARHPGSVRGYKSLILSYPHEGHAIVLLTNAAKAPRFEIADRLTELLRETGIWQ